MLSVDFVLEALENEVTLSILEFANLLFMLELVVFHGGGHIVCICRVLGVKHVGGKVKNRLLIVALLVVFTDLSL
jgi:hypothetical protein